MIATAAKTVREIAVENPSATRVFETLGIDYCCGGQKSLNDACASANVSVEEVIKRLEDAEQQTARDATGKDWQSESITSLVEHIVSTHHVYVKEESPRLQQLMAKIVSVHGKNHPELLKVREIVDALTAELATHLMKEEQILFPYLTRVDASSAIGLPAPSSCFGTVQNPIRMMMLEHDSAGDALRDLRIVTNDYTVPEDACITYQTAYRALQDFEKDLHQHIHLENNILFPRALATEAAA